MSQHDVLAEHKALRTERDELLRLIREEWGSMFYEAARTRQARVEAIDVRIKAIERTKAWKGRPIGLK